MRRGAIFPDTLLAALVAVVVALATMTPPSGIAPADAAGPALAVIVHPSRTESVEARDLVRIYLRKRRFWNDGSPIVPLNREAGSVEREAFSASVFGAESTYLAAYWNERYFHGVFPPTVLASNEAIKRYVATDRGAIGYIDAREIDSSVHVVLTIAIGGAVEPPP